MVNDRTEKLRLEYANTRPSICVERAKAFTKSYIETEGEPAIIRRAKAFKRACSSIPVKIFEDETIVGTAGSFQKSGFICPELSWKWVEHGIDTLSRGEEFSYIIGERQRHILTEEIFPYWKGKSLEETFLARLPKETAIIVVDAGIRDKDSKKVGTAGQIIPDIRDVIFKKGFKGIKKEAQGKLDSLEPLSADALEKISFYKAAIETCDAIVTLARRYSAAAFEMAAFEQDMDRKRELIDIGIVCSHVPERPPVTFTEAVQMVWFVQLGGLLSENSPVLSVEDIDWYIDPFYENDINNGTIAKERAQEMIGLLRLKLSQSVCAMSKNTSQYFNGVPTANINLAMALEYAVNNGRSRITGEKVGLDEDLSLISSFEEFKHAYFKQLANIIKHSAIMMIVAQQVHSEMAPRPFSSLLAHGCMQTGRDLSRNGAKHNSIPVLEGIGAMDVAELLLAVRKLVFENEEISIDELSEVLADSLSASEELGRRAKNGFARRNDIDDIAAEIADFCIKETNKYSDFFGAPFNFTITGISD